MKIFVRVTPGAAFQSIEQIDDTHYHVKVTARPHDGKANEAVIKVLAKHFRAPKSAIELCSGRTSRTKVFEIHC
ncbi:DUF167 domain-containing protein [Candidatus Uhrbacteria bacterium]|nr:DUF167 domain-containing protein [Candidatus Uhrbacteria bacterium]